MSTKDVILDAWARAPKEWHCDVVRVAARLPSPVSWKPVPEEELCKYVPVSAVEFRREIGRVDGAQWGRVVGAFQGMELIVAEGPL